MACSRRTTTRAAGRAAVRVLEAAGYHVRITRRTVCCGLTWISTGQLDGARRQLRRTLGELGPVLDDGIPIVGLEPSCTAALRRDAGELLPGERGEAPGEQVPPVPGDDDRDHPRRVLAHPSAPL